MTYQLVSRTVFSNESAKLHIFPSHFLHARTLSKHCFQLIVAQIPVLNGFVLQGVEMVFHSLDHTVKAHLSGVWNKREHGVIYITFYLFNQFWNQTATQLNTLVVDVSIVSTREVDALERTRFVVERLLNLLNTDIAVMLHNNGRPRWQFIYLVRLNVQRRLDYWALRSHHHNLIVVVIEGRANSGRVS